MDTDTTIAGRSIPWNKGKLLGQKPPLKRKEIWAIRIRLQLDHRARELAICHLAIDRKLRGCDLVRLRVHDAVQGRTVTPRAMAMQKKHQRPVQFEITEQTRDAVAAGIFTFDESLQYCRSEESLLLNIGNFPAWASYAFPHTLGHERK